MKISLIFALLLEVPCHSHGGGFGRWFGGIGGWDGGDVGLYGGPTGRFEGVNVRYDDSYGGYGVGRGFGHQGGHITSGGYRGVIVAHREAKDVGLYGGVKGDHKVGSVKYGGDRGGHRRVLDGYKETGGYSDGR